MDEYLNLHHALDARRTLAKQGDFSQGPRTLVSRAFRDTAKAAVPSKNPPMLTHSCCADCWTDRCGKELLVPDSAQLCCALRLVAYHD